MKPDLPLSREAFRSAVLSIRGGLCSLCGATASDAHHIMDRKLFPDGGYLLANGAPVCDKCHMACETTEISVEEVLLSVGLSSPILPEGLDPSAKYDKWGNEVLPDGSRLPGPLFWDDGCQRSLARGNRLWLFPRANKSWT